MESLYLKNSENEKKFKSNNFQKAIESDDCNKIQIESVDSSFKEENIKNNYSSDSSASKLSSTKKNKHKRGKKKTSSRKSDKKHSRSRTSEKSQSDSSSRYNSRSSSNSTSVSGLLSDSDSENSVNNSSHSSEISSGESEKNLNSKKKRFQVSKKRKQESSHKRSTSSHSSSSNYENGELSDNSDEESSDQEKRSLGTSKKRSNEQIIKLRKKCNNYKKEIKKTIKQLKIFKKKKTLCNSNKEKLRYDIHAKKFMKRKKKLEKKYEIYQNHLDTYINKNSKESDTFTGDSKMNRYTRDINSFEEKKKNLKKESQDYDDIEIECKNQYVDLVTTQSEENSSLNMKLPYPVLNDKRDHRIIFKILKNKQNHLNDMLEKTLDTLEDIRLNGDKSSHQENTDVRENRLRILEDNIKLQLTRLSRQIDFIDFTMEVAKYSKILENLKEIDQNDQNYEKILRLRKKMNEINKKIENLVVFMRDANHRFLKQQEDLRCHRQSEKMENQTSMLEDRTMKSEEKTFETAGSSLPIDYYKNVPPPSLKKNASKTQLDKEIGVNPRIQSNKPTNINPNHNIQKIVAESANFNTQKNSTFGYNQEKKNFYENRMVMMKNDTNSSTYKNKVEIVPSNAQKNSNSDKELKITPDSDPKAIAAMLNEKYGYKKKNDSVQQEALSKKMPSKLHNNKNNENQKDRNQATGKVETNDKGKNPMEMNEPSLSAKSSNHEKNSYLGENLDNQAKSNANYRKFDRKNNKNNSHNSAYDQNMLSANLPTSMLNSPAFMSTMTSLLHSMSQQGVNVNAILKQMPNILSSFNAGNDMSFTNSNNSYNNNKRNDNRNNRRNNYQRGFNEMNSNMNTESALLPNPTEFQNQANDEFTQAFCNYLTDFSQNMDIGMDLPNMLQLKRMFFEGEQSGNNNNYFQSQRNYPNNSHNNYNFNSYTNNQQMNEYHHDNHFRNHNSNFNNNFNDINYGFMYDNNDPQQFNNLNSFPKKNNRYNPKNDRSFKRKKFN